MVAYAAFLGVFVCVGIDVAGKGMAVAGKGVMDMTNKLGGATLASLEVRPYSSDAVKI
jgi:hypothetical protein